MLHLITCHGHIMPRLVELLFYIKFLETEGSWHAYPGEGGPGVFPWKILECQRSHVTKFYRLTKSVSI